jgi:hypothetical protein
VARVQDKAIGVLLDLETEQKRPEDLLREVREVIDSSQKALDEIARREQEQLAAKIRKYQDWALARITDYNEWPFDSPLSWIQKRLRAVDGLGDDSDWDLLIHYPWSKEVIQEKLGIPMGDVRGARLTPQQRKAIQDNLGWPTWKNTVDQELAYRAIREAMIKYLLPINLAYLEPPVAQLYQKAFARGWEKLEGRQDQLEVAKATISVPKKLLE